MNKETSCACDAPTKEKMIFLDGEFFTSLSVCSACGQVADDEENPF